MLIIGSCKAVTTFVCKGLYLSKDMCPKDEAERKEMSKTPYAHAVGSLMYAMTSTRLDICHAVGLVSRYQSDPRLGH